MRDALRVRLLAILLWLIPLLLVLAPVLFPGAKALNVAEKIAVFIVLVASYDLLIGYTGIVSFAHTMFYGIGGYGVGLALYALGPSWAAIALGLVAALALAAVVALLVALVSLRVQAIFFAMITLAVGSTALLLAQQLSSLTGGEDGRTFRVPELLQPSFRLLAQPLLGVAVNGRLITYYLVLGSALLLFLVLRRVVGSPFGRVLQAIRENPFRTEALGYRAVVYRSLATVIAAAIAAAAGGLNAVWLRYVGPDTTLSFAIMLDILLMVVIGGMGTLNGAVIGATLFVLAENYLQSIMAGANLALADIPLVAALVHPDRWLLWLGVLFILSVYFFPAGIVGSLRRRS